jgi:hypothetical protein
VFKPRVETKLFTFLSTIFCDCDFIFFVNVGFALFVDGWVVE